MVTFRKWAVPSLIMLCAMALEDIVGDGGLAFGWIGGAIALAQWPSLHEVLAAQPSPTDKAKGIGRWRG